jgi:type I restriction enzyme S subunit
MNVMSNVVLNAQGTEKVRIGNGERQSQVLEGDVIFNGSSETPEEVGFGSAVPIEISGLGFAEKIRRVLTPGFLHTSQGRRLVETSSDRWHRAQRVTTLRKQIY